MLSEMERRRLEELDRLMISEAPVLAEACRDMRLPSRTKLPRRVLVVLCVILAGVVLVTAAIVQEAALVGLGLLLVGIAGVYHLRHGRDSTAA
jgi:DUF3040 family protein